MKLHCSRYLAFIYSLKLKSQFDVRDIRQKNRAANDIHFISGKKKCGEKMNLQRMNS